MRIAAIVDTLECIFRKQEQLRQCKDEAVAKSIRATIVELTTAIPPPSAIPLIGSVRALAGLNAEMTNLVEKVTANEKEIERLTKEASKDAWKWSARKEGPKVPAAVVALRETNTNLNAQLDVLELKAEPFRKLLAMEQRALDEEAQLRAWVAGGYADPRPLTIQNMQEQERAALSTNCLHLAIPVRDSISIVIT